METIHFLHEDLHAMSEDNDDDSWDEDRELEWEKETRLALPYAKSNLPHCHPSYRNQELITCRQGQIIEEKNNVCQNNVMVVGHGYCDFEKLEANARKLTCSKN